MVVENKEGVETLVKPVGPKPTPTLEEFVSSRCTDNSNGVRFVKHFGETAKHSKSHGWLVYDGARWKRDPKAARELAQNLPALIRGEVRELEFTGDLSGTEGLRRYESFVKALGKHAATTGSSKGIDSALREAAVKPGVKADDIQFDSDPFLLNCLNGTIDLRTGEHREHKRADHITKLCPVNFSSEARCPRWMAFLDEVFMGDRDLIDYVQWAVGYSMTGLVYHQIFFLMLGGGCNGKGVFIRTLADIFGEDYAQELNPEEIMAQRNARHDSGKAALAGVRFLSVGETEEGRQLNEALVKKLTGGDKIRANFMRQDGFEFYPEFKLWLATNYLPTVRDSSHGMWRRIRLIPFERTFEGAAIDPELGRKLQDEREGILAWCVEGAKRFKEEPALP